MKRHVFLLLTVIGSIICGCGNNADDSIINTNTDASIEILSIDELQNDEKVIEYFNDLNMTIISAELEKRKTDEETGYDYAYLNIVAENESAKLVGEYEITSCFYDIGGWQVDNIRSEGAREYQPQENYDYLPIVNASYLEYYKDPEYELEIVSTQKISVSQYKVNAIIRDQGTISDYVVEGYYDVVFNSKLGTWKCDYYQNHYGVALHDVNKLKITQQIGDKIYTLYISIKNGELSVNQLFINQEEMKIQSVYKSQSPVYNDAWVVSYYKGRVSFRTQRDEITILS